MKTEPMILLPDEYITKVREQDKRVRFCPSCGSQRLLVKALHWNCRVCLHSFFAAPATDVKSIKPTERAPTMCSFTVMVDVHVPTERCGVQDLLREITSGVDRFSVLLDPPEKE